MSELTSVNQSASSSPGPGLASIKVENLRHVSSDLMPAHIKKLMTINGDNDFISIHEWGIRVCYAMLVEVGFFPYKPEVLKKTALELLEMSDYERISKYGGMLSSEDVFSAQGIYNMSFIVVKSELANVEVSKDGSKDTKAENTSDKTQTSNPTDSNPTQEWQYNLSEKVQITAIIGQDKTTLSGSTRCGKKAVTHNYTLNIEEFLINRPRILPTHLRADQWGRKFEVNYGKLSERFKRDFAVHFMDKIDGLSFEKKGICFLPYHAYFKILYYLDISSILKFGFTCATFYDITRDNLLWKKLYERDFGRHEDGNSGSENVDFYTLYKQKYLSKRRGMVHRYYSVPITIRRPLAPLRRRMPSTPFQFLNFM